MKKISIIFLILILLVFISQENTIEEKINYIKKNLKNSLALQYLNEVDNYIKELIEELKQTNEALIELNKENEMLTEQNEELKNAIDELTTQLENNNEVLKEALTIIQAKEKKFSLSLIFIYNFYNYPSVNITFAFNSFLLGAGVFYDMQMQKFNFNVLVGIKIIF